MGVEGDGSYHLVLSLHAGTIVYRRREPCMESGAVQDTRRKKRVVLKGYAMQPGQLRHPIADGGPQRVRRPGGGGSQAPPSISIGGYTIRWPPKPKGRSAGRVVGRRSGATRILKTCGVTFEASAARGCESPSQAGEEHGQAHLAHRSERMGRPLGFGGD
ncbi:hypothetical protein MRX96_002851 [Rhipicephalus microplus]